MIQTVNAFDYVDCFQQCHEEHAFATTVLTTVHFSALQNVIA